MRAPVLVLLTCAAVIAAVASARARSNDGEGFSHAIPAGPIRDDDGDPGDDPDCPAPRPGTLTLSTTPWTVVYLNGVVVGTTPLYRFELPSGEHQLSLVNAARGVAVIEDVTIEEGRAHKLKLLLVAEATETVLDGAADADSLDCVDDADAGYVTVQTTPWSKVWIDGKLVGVTPLFQQRVRAGDHALRFKGKDGQLFATRVLVANGEVVKVALALPAPFVDPVDELR